jgi:hypothetical protein
LICAQTRAWMSFHGVRSEAFDITLAAPSNAHAHAAEAPSNAASRSDVASGARGMRGMCAGICVHALCGCFRVCLRARAGEMLARRVDGQPAPWRSVELHSGAVADVHARGTCTVVMDAVCSRQWVLSMMGGDLPHVGETAHVCAFCACSLTPGCARDASCMQAQNEAKEQGCGNFFGSMRM